MRRQNSNFEQLLELGELAPAQFVPVIGKLKRLMSPSEFCILQRGGNGPVLRRSYRDNYPVLVKVLVVVKC